MDIFTMNEALLIGGIVAVGLLVAALIEATRRRKKRPDDDGPRE